MKVFVAMSGGVDSSTAAAVLKEGGHEVIGITMQLWPRQDRSDSGSKTSCCGLDAIEDARHVADHLDIPHYVLNFRDVFKHEIISPFVEEYLKGRTPNPCIRCNEVIKFDVLLRKVLSMGADYLATGHYAQIVRVRQQSAVCNPQSEHQRHCEKSSESCSTRQPNLSINKNSQCEESEGRRSNLTSPNFSPKSDKYEYRLLKGVDKKKDQSYFLWTFTQEQLKSTLLPLGGLGKEEVRNYAREAGLPVAEKKESQEICFIPDNDYRSFLRERSKKSGKPGQIVDKQGDVIGEHQGIADYTIGQRKGLGGSSAKPRYVVAIDAGSNKIVVGYEEDTYQQSLVCGSVNIISGKTHLKSTRAEVAIRYNAEPVDAAISSIGPDKIKVVFDKPQKAITPGQSVVYYREDLVIGGGIIE